MKKMKLTLVASTIVIGIISTEPSIAQARRLTPGVYSAGSRYISVVHQGEKTCYQGISIPPGRYSIAVGETTGTLTYNVELDSFVIDGWQDYGRDITLEQQGSALAVSHDGVFAGEYSFFGESGSFGLSEAMVACLNASGPFFEATPGYTITLPRVQYSTTTSQARTDIATGDTDSIIWVDVPGTVGEFGYLGQVGENTVNRQGDQITFDVGFDGMYARFNGNCRTKVLYPLLQADLDRDGQPIDPRTVPHAEWFQPDGTMVNFLDMACSIG